MSDAPALPAQTPGMFLGGGGSGAALSGECAAAVADAGLEAADFGSVEAVTESVEAAAGRCQDYQQARWLEEVEREFEPDAAAASSAAAERGRPSLRQRHLQQCVAAPLLDPRFFRGDVDDPRTNVAAGPGQSPPGAAGYDPLRALAAPSYTGPVMRTAVLAVASKLAPPLVDRPRGEPPGRRPEGAPLSEPDTTVALRLAAAAVLRAAASEDAPRLRSVNLSRFRRARQEESERRDAERARPEPPTLAETVQPEASGVDPSADAGSDAPDSETEASASGCVEANSGASVAAMREEVHAEHSSADPEAEEAVEQEDLAARRTLTRATSGYAQRSGQARAASMGGPSVSSARAQAACIRAASGLAGALVRAAVAGARRAAAGAMGEQALLLESNDQVGSPAISGQVPALRSPAPRQRSTERLDLLDG